LNENNRVLNHNAALTAASDDNNNNKNEFSNPSDCLLSLMNQDWTNQRRGSIGQ
jgi:hypothetical protein